MIRIMMLGCLALSLSLSLSLGSASSYASAKEADAKAPKANVMGLTLESLTITSDLIEPAEFKVTLPASYGNKPNKQYVVLLGLHPRSQALLAGMHDWMSHNGDWPWLETIIVTPPDGHQGLGELKTLAIEQQGNQKLLDYFEQDLLPAIDNKYRTNGFRILNGFVGDAGLSLYSLINRPSLFNAYFVASPALSKDFAYVIKDAPKKLAAMQGEPRFLFMSTNDSSHDQRQLGAFAEMEAILKANASDTLDYRIKRFDGSYYMTQPVLAAAYAIEALFDDYHQVLAADSEISKQGPQAIVAHYQYLSEQKYGFKVPATRSLIKLGDSYLETEPTKAIEVYQVAITDDPKTVIAYDAVAGAYAKLGDFEQAIKYQALALDKTNHSFYKKKYSQKLAEYKQQSKL
ncbi:alpha/beta hydrolase-fold protein [uncultured Shewanella sp.]|uniref:alpha/beta hydrolase-fold protein n=1 Tax=uncultured Shewanella sp. TaxID=173975 RepID=UPI0026346CD7|nr:alpha/beta hydrolase-fold protein [uncultured Shewanella sp.]